MVKIHTFSKDLPAEIANSFKESVSVDTELTGLDVPKYDRLSLIQICGKDSKEIYLVQPDKKNYDSPNLVKVLSNPKITVIMHFSRMDKKAIEYFLKCKVTNVWDTKIASRLVRRYSSEHGLSNLAQEFCSVRLEKKLASSDWNKPISDFSEKEKAYAAADVQYLFQIKEKLEKMLKRENRYELFLKCMAWLDVRIELDNQGFDKIFDH